MSHPLYGLRTPERWAATLEVLSFSSLRALEQCPRQWQLRSSSWPGLGVLPRRPHPAALEGTLVHEVLDLLFRALALAGVPPVGSSAFRAVLARLDVMAQIRQRLDAANALLSSHPRRAAFLMPHDARAVYNRVANLFQREYAAVEPSEHELAAEPRRPTDNRHDPLSLLSVRGVLTEWPVAHPRLPLRGVIDLLRRDAAGTHLVDFKTGAPRAEYTEQLQLYALMWWRATGDLPTSLTLRHPRGRSPIPVDAGRLVALEDSLEGRIAAVQRALEATPAPARAGAHCSHCDVRMFCDDYWTTMATPAAEGPKAPCAVDAEVVVPEVVDRHGFVTTQGKRRLPVVWEDDGTAVHGPFTPGETLRIVDAWLQDGALRLTGRSEVFHRPA